MEVIPNLAVPKADETTLPVAAHIDQTICACKPFGKTSFSAFHQVASSLGLGLVGYGEISDVLCVHPWAF